jgi:hypothetical protein
VDLTDNYNGFFSTLRIAPNLINKDMPTTTTAAGRFAVHVFYRSRHMLHDRKEQPRKAVLKNKLWQQKPAADVSTAQRKAKEQAKKEQEQATKEQEQEQATKDQAQCKVKAAPFIIDLWCYRRRVPLIWCPDRFTCTCRRGLDRIPAFTCTCRRGLDRIPACCMQVP